MARPTKEPTATVTWTRNIKRKTTTILFAWGRRRKWSIYRLLFIGNITTWWTTSNMHRLYVLLCLIGKHISHVSLRYIYHMADTSTERCERCVSDLVDALSFIYLSHSYSFIRKWKWMRRLVCDFLAFCFFFLSFSDEFSEVDSPLSVEWRSTQYGSVAKCDINALAWSVFFCPARWMCIGRKCDKSNPKSTVECLRAPVNRLLVDGHMTFSLRTCLFMKELPRNTKTNAPHVGFKTKQHIHIWWRERIFGTCST